MQVNELLNKAAMLLGESVRAETDPTDERTIRLLNALGVSYMQLITEYAPLEEKESIAVVEGMFDLQALTKKFFDVIKLTDDEGELVTCHVRGGKLFAEDGQYTLYYSYTPSAYPALGGTIEIPPRITADLLARGVAAEYAIGAMMYEEASVFEKRYKEGLANILTSRRSIRLPVGRWI